MSFFHPQNPAVCALAKQKVVEEAKDRDFYSAFLVLRDFTSEEIAQEVLDQKDHIWKTCELFTVDITKCLEESNAPMWTDPGRGPVLYDYPIVMVNYDDGKCWAILDGMHRYHRTIRLKIPTMHVYIVRIPHLKKEHFHGR